MILFYSDYLEGAHPEILRRLQETNMAQTPGYGLDCHCKNARNLIRELCKAQDADVHFLVGGTQANMTVIAATLRPHQGVVCAETGHINVHETGAIEHSGHKVLTIPSHDGKIDAGELDALLKAHHDEETPEHTVQPGMVYISFPTELGTVYSKEELKGIGRVCGKWGIPMFIDGARLGYGLAAADCDLTLPDIAEVADVFYIGGTKQGALFGEAVVIRNDSIKKDFRYLIKQNGGLLAKGRLLGIQFNALLANGLYKEISVKADRLADRIRDAFREKGVKFLVENRTNQIFPILAREQARSLSGGFGFEKWEDIDAGRTAFRFCTSWATTDENVDLLVKAISEL